MQLFLQTSFHRLVVLISFFPQMVEFAMNAFVRALLLLAPHDIESIRIRTGGCVILREIDFLLIIC